MMFQPWAMTGPADLLNFWGQPIAPKPAAPPSPQQQILDLFQAFQSLCESYMKQGSDFTRQQQFGDLTRSFALNPVFTAIPSSEYLMPNNPFSNWIGSRQTQPSWGAQTPQFPALGITREFQEDQNKWIKLHEQFASAYGEYLQLFRDFSQNVSEKFSNLLSGSGSTQNFDELIRKWIGICESEFQKIASTPEYSHAFGKLVNSSVQLQNHVNRMQERFSQLQGHPSRAELDELHQKNSKTSAEMKMMQQEIVQLRKTVEQLQKPKPKVRKERS